MNFVEPILRLGRLQPEAEALIDGDRIVTYGELAVLVPRTSGHLAALGVKPGDRVGLCLKDSWAHLVTMLAVGRMGAVVVPIDWRARPQEKSRVADALGLKLVLAEPESQVSWPCPAVALDEVWHRHVALASQPATLPDDWQAPFMISSTSGSTGAPKFVQVTHFQLYFSNAIKIEMMALTARRCFLSVLPLYFSGGRGWCLAQLWHGDCVILHPPLLTAEEYVALIRKHKASAGYIGPMILRQLLRIAPASGYLLPETTLYCGGAPLFAEEKLEALRKVTPHFFQAYGTAATDTICLLRPDVLSHRPESVGQPHPMMEIEVVDDDDRKLEPGAVGRFRCRGPNVASGLAGPNGWEGAHEGFRDGWYYPGDLATLDPEGYLFLKGRGAELIIRGGAKIHPLEIETALREHDAVAEAAVLGRHMADGEDEVVAFVVARRPVETGALAAHCRARLTPYKLPREIHIVGELPKNAAGKIDKLELRRRLDEPDQPAGSSRAPPGHVAVSANPGE
jgi:acyl-CoA synthetase (AMP-forming)/AMP-acid ligase II